MAEYFSPLYTVKFNGRTSRAIVFSRGLWAALFTGDGGADGSWQKLQPLPDGQLDTLMAGMNIAAFLLYACAHKQPPAAIETIADQQARLDRAFHVKFRGRFVELFQESLNSYAEIYDKSTYYGCMIPFVQASGTRKSRLAWELGLRMPAFCVCFQEGELLTSGWPPRDVSRKFFDGLDEHFTFMAEEKSAAFLGALVEVLHDTTPVDLSLKAWVDAWSLEDPTDLERSHRHRCFEQVKQLTERRLSEFKTELYAMRPSHSSTRAVEACWHVLLFEMLAKPGFDLLAELVRVSTSAQNSTIPAYLLRIIKAADEFTFLHGIEFWYMLLHTNSSLYELSPFGTDASSYRLTGALKPLPVWSYVDFDQMRRDVELKNAEHALLICFLAMFGRPYLYTLGDSPDVVPAARKKLIYDDEFDPI